MLSAQDADEAEASKGPNGAGPRVPEVVASGPSVRVDQWLCACRMFKSRTQAARACSDGHVTVNGDPVKPSRIVRVGDEVRARAPRGDVVLVVQALAVKRLGPVPARELYEDRSPPLPEPELALGRRERGAGRPTKQERRALVRFRGGE